MSNPSSTAAHLYCITSCLKASILRRSQISGMVPSMCRPLRAVGSSKSKWVELVWIRSPKYSSWRKEWSIRQLRTEWACSHGSSPIVITVSSDGGHGDCSSVESTAKLLGIFNIFTASYASQSSKGMKIQKIRVSGYSQR